MAEAPGHKQFAYDDFTGGERGALSARYSAANMFHASNMLVYRDGTIGPRPGLRAVPVSGDDWKEGNVNTLTFGIANDGTTQRVFYQQGQNVYAFDGENDASVEVLELTGTLASSPEDETFGILPRLGFNQYISVYGDTTYQINGPADTVTALSGAPGGKAVIEYQDALYLGDADVIGQVRYSAPADFNSWPAENFFDVGVDWPIQHMFRLKNGLLMTTQHQEWYLLQGSPVSGSLRQIDLSRTPGRQGSGVYADGKIWYMASQSTTGSFPVAFDGNEADVKSFRYLRHIPGGDPLGAVYLLGDNDILFFGRDSNKAVIRCNGVWTFHEYGIDVAERGADFKTAIYYLLTQGVTPVEAVEAVEADPEADPPVEAVEAVEGVEGVKPLFYRSMVAVDRPGFVTDSNGQPGDNSEEPVDTFLEFKEEWLDNGDGMRVKAVMVDFTAYDTGSETPNQLDVSVRLINRSGGSLGNGVTDLATQTWTGLAADATEDGVRERYIFRAAGVSPANGVQVRLANIKGIKIERVLMDVEIVPGMERY